MTPVLLALSAGFAPIAIWVLAVDPEGDLGFLGWLLICPGGLVTAWTCLAVLWRPDRDYGTLNFAPRRAVAVPLFAAPLLGVVNLLTRHLPPVAGRVEDSTNPEYYHPRYWFAQSDVPAGSMVIGGGKVLSLVAGLAATAFLVWPINAIWTPERMIGDSWLDTSPENRATNVLAVPVYALMRSARPPRGGSTTCTG